MTASPARRERRRLARERQAEEARAERRQAALDAALAELDKIHSDDDLDTELPPALP